MAGRKQQPIRRYDMKFSAVIFDLDGTLLATLDDIANSANLVLQRLGLPLHPLESYSRFVGEGVTMLFRRAIPQAESDERLVTRAVALFREIYDENWNVSSCPYVGIPELLSQLAGRNVSLAVLSNKPHVFTQKCIDEYLPDVPFDAVLGQREGIPCKPDPVAALEIAGQIGCTAGECIFLGDTATDMKTAVNAGMLPVGVLWGFRPREELEISGAARIIEQPLDLLQYFEPS